jgi:hypothetical protein
VSDVAVFNFGLFISAAAFCRLPALLPVIQTLAPALINAFAVANPMPVLPPVMITFLFVKSIFENLFKMITLV